MYILARVYNSKKAKRHIVLRGTMEGIEEWLYCVGALESKRYKYSLYTGNWRLVKTYN